MSTVDLSSAQETQEQRDKGEKSFLSQQERDTVKRLLSFPEEFPPEFGSWLVEYLGTAGVYQKYQVQGLPLLNSQVQDSLDTLSVIGTTYSDSQPSSVSVTNGVNTTPSVTVPKGTYFCILVAQITILGGAGSCSMQLYNVPGAVAFGSLALFSGDVDAVGTILSIGSVAFTGDSNDIQVTYAKAGSGNRNASNRLLIALRTG